MLADWREGREAKNNSAKSLVLMEQWYILGCSLHNHGIVKYWKQLRCPSIAGQVN